MKPGTKKITRILAASAGLIIIAVLIVFLTRFRVVTVPDGDQLASYSTEPWREVLALYGREGLFDYAGLRGGHETQLNRYLDAVSRFGPRSTPELFSNRDEQLAYYLNSYNAIMLRKWLNEGAGERVAKTQVVNKAWFVFDLWQVDGTWVSLNTLEQKIIRPAFNDHRVHFALVCGAMSCPPLLEVPFSGGEAGRLDEQLDGLGRRWLREADGLELAEDGSVRLSSIFNWYKADFDPPGGIEGVLERYLADDDPRREAAISAAREGRIEYMPYDWSINQSP